MPLERPRWDRQDRHPGLLVRVDVDVDPDDPPFARVELALVAIGRVGDLTLRVALLDCGDHPAAPVDLIEVTPDLSLGLIGQGLDEPGPAERIDGGVRAALLGDDLLLTERQ